MTDTRAHESRAMAGWKAVYHGPRPQERRSRGAGPRDGIDLRCAAPAKALAFHIMTGTNRDSTRVPATVLEK